MPLIIAYVWTLFYPHQSQSGRKRADERDWPSTKYREGVELDVILNIYNFNRAIG